MKDEGNGLLQKDLDEMTRVAMLKYGGSKTVAVHVDAEGRLCARCDGKAAKFPLKGRLATQADVENVVEGLLFRIDFEKDK